MSNRYLLVVRLAAVLLLLTSRCLVNAWMAPFVADLSTHSIQFAAWAQHALGVAPAWAAEVATAPTVDPSSSSSAFLNIDMLVAGLPPFSPPDVKIEVPDVSEATEYVGDVGSKFGRVGSNFVRMSGLTNAPQTAEALARQTQDVVGGLGKAVGDIRVDIPSVDLKKVADILPKEVTAEESKVRLWPAWTRLHLPLH